MGFNLGFKGLKDSNRTPAARLGPEINSRACLCILHGPRHNTRFCFSIERFIFLLIYCLETPKKGWGPTNHWTEPLLASLLVISFPRTPACRGTQYSLTACRVEISFNACWHCRTKGTQYSLTACRVEISFNACWHCRTKGAVVLAAWSAFRAAWLSEQIHVSLTDPEFQFHEHRLVSHILQTERLRHVYLERYWAFCLHVAHRLQPWFPPQSWTHP